MLFLIPLLVSATDPEEPLVIHPNQFFVEIDSLATLDPAILSALLTDLNAFEVWREEDLNLSIWQINGFPFVSDGVTILDIDGAITASRKKVKIRSASFNVQQAIVTNNTGSTEFSCFDIADYFATQGDETIKISILDTGISDISDNSGSSGYNYNLTSYTGYDYVNNDAIPEDEHGHGSHLAGIMHSITHQANPSSPSITYDIRKTHDSLGQAFMSSVVIALIDAKKDDADIINMSFSVNDTYHDTLFYPLKNVITWLETEGILVIAAAGNDLSNNDDMSDTALPASFPTNNIVAVASTNCNQQLSSYSNFGGLSVDIATLGENIPGPDLNTGISCLSGTSQAAAVVTAIAALHASQREEFDLALTKCALINTSTHYVDLGDMVSSDGLLNVPAVMAASDSICVNTGNNCDINFTGANTLTGLNTANTLYETSHTIESTQSVLSNTHLSYDALLSTSLSQGFEVQNGASFVIATDGCQH